MFQDFHHKPLNPNSSKLTNKSHHYRTALSLHSFYNPAIIILTRTPIHERIYFLHFAICHFTSYSTTCKVYDAIAFVAREQCNKKIQILPDNSIWKIKSTSRFFLCMQDEFYKWKTLYVIVCV
ncbi:hypothetical protein ACKWTF_010144 [Chironomus riparius]